jgi:5-methylcytosine-specific restriction endonuclease McrA
MDAALRTEVWRRAGGRCEYCRMPSEHDDLTFEVEHVVPRKHGGPTISANLSLACFPCNRHKGTNLSGFDPDTGDIVTLFDPRRDEWTAHFKLAGAVLEGLTPRGRATIAVLRMNEPMRVALREMVLRLGAW